MKTTIVVHTAQGPRDVPVTMCGSLAIHESVGVPGWSVSHQSSGCKIISRLTTKLVAMAIARFLLTKCDWSRPVIPSDELDSIRVLLRAIPRRLIRKYTRTKSQSRGPPVSDEGSTEEAHL